MIVKLDIVCDHEICDLIGVRGEFVNYYILQGIFEIEMGDFGKK